jgi:hypothetical protein
MLRAIAHSAFRDHAVNLACEGCLEHLGFACVRGYAGNAEYPTCAEALGPNDAYDAYEPIGGARATDRHQDLDCDNERARDSDCDSAGERARASLTLTSTSPYPYVHVRVVRA